MPTLFAPTSRHEILTHRVKLLILFTLLLLFLALPRAASAAELDDLEIESAPPSPEIVYTPEPSTQTTGRVIDVLPPKRKVGYWTIGVGPFIGHQLGAEKAMYDFAIGYVWDINPRASVKTFGESNFSSSAENARFLNAAVGVNAFFPKGDSSPYATADIGYGFARNARTETAEGFSLGVGAGFQFFRTTETTLDLLLRYAVIFDDFADGSRNPSVTGLRLAVNF